MAGLRVFCVHASSAWFGLAPAVASKQPLLYRAALSEMIVPYGDSDNMHSWKHVLDASEYNMGMLVNSLKLGCDCLGEIFYFDVHQVTWEGKVKSVENAICMHEEDYGIQWKHYDSESQSSEVRRSRRLVISSIFTIGNYDYGFYWYLYRRHDSNGNKADGYCGRQRSDG